MPEISVSEELLAALEKQRTSEEDTLEDVLWDLVEDRMSLSDAVLESIERNKDGPTVSLDDLKRKYSD